LNPQSGSKELMGKQCKIITYDDFYAAGLSPTIEYGESYCDIIYARRILQKMGYQVLISSAFNVIKK